MGSWFRDHRLDECEQTALVIMLLEKGKVGRTYIVMVVCVKAYFVAPREERRGRINLLVSLIKSNVSVQYIQSLVPCV